MNCAWHGSLEEALASARTGRWPEVLGSDGPARQTSEPTPDGNLQWSKSLPLVLDALASSEGVRRDLHVALEYRLPFNGQRIDLLLLGRRGAQATAHVVELKHWAASSGFDDSDTLVEIQGNATTHPSYQAATYAGKIKHLHSVGMSYAVGGAAAITSGTRATHSTLYEDRFRWLVSEAPLFFADDLSSLSTRVSEALPEAPGFGQAEEFLAGEYSQSLRLLDAIKLHGREIERGALAALAVSGWGLSAEQNLVLGEVLSTIKSGNEGTFIISGGPGSGKTLLALHILLLSAGLQRRVVMGIRNNRMNEALREILNRQVPGAKGMLKYFSVRNGSGVEDPDGPNVDVLVCDEAQRLGLRSDRVFRRAPVTVVIHDESQILNSDDRGELSLLTRRAREAGKQPRIFGLPTPHRCRGGERYVKWVEQFLSDPSAVNFIPAIVRREYSLLSVRDIDDLRNRLRHQVGTGRRVALMASFTRGSGHDKPVDQRDLGRIRIPASEATFPLQWLMDPKKEYVPFWVGGSSNQLLHCSSIYGCQGFETDFAGLIWGTDFVIRSGRWQIGDPADCYDTIGPGRGLRGLMENGDPRAMPLLRARYRIFMTRGIFGTVLFCEDPETRAFLDSALQTRQST